MIPSSFSFIYRGGGSLRLERGAAPSGFEKKLKFLKKILKIKYKNIDLTPTQLICKFYI